MTKDNFLTLIFLLSVSIWTINAQSSVDKPYSKIFEYKDSIASINSIENLINKPSVIDSNIDKEEIDGKKLLQSFVDTHAIFEIPIYKLINMVLDLENEQNIFPRMTYTKDLLPSASLWSPRLQEVKSEFKMGILESSYHYIFYKIPELREDGSFLIKWNLYDSIDGKFDYLFGSWYMKELTFKGKNYTYVRNYTHYGIINYPFFVPLAINLGGKQDSIGFFKALLKASE
jgi:hypothetical protein